MSNPFEKIDVQLNEIQRMLMELTTNASPIKEASNSKLLNMDGVSELLGLAKPTIYTKVSKGEIPGVIKQGKKLLFNKAEILEWMMSCKHKSLLPKKSPNQLIKMNKKLG